MEKSCDLLKVLWLGRVPDSIEPRPLGPTVIYSIITFQKPQHCLYWGRKSSSATWTLIHLHGHSSLYCLSLPSLSWVSLWVWPTCTFSTSPLRNCSVVTSAEPTAWSSSPLTPFGRLGKKDSFCKLKRHLCVPISLGTYLTG